MRAHTRASRNENRLLRVPTARASPRGVALMRTTTEAGGIPGVGIGSLTGSLNVSTMGASHGTSVAPFSGLGDAAGRNGTVVRNVWLVGKEWVAPFSGLAAGGCAFGRGGWRPTAGNDTRDHTDRVSLRPVQDGRRGRGKAAQYRTSGEGERRRPGTGRARPNGTRDSWGVHSLSAPPARFLMVALHPLPKVLPPARAS